MSAWLHDEIENAQRAWRRAQLDYPIEQSKEQSELRPTRPIMEGRGPQIASPRKAASS